MKIAIYSKDACPFCIKAIYLLKATDIPFDEFKLDKDFTRDEILEQFPDARTFPIVTLDNEWIGGYTELKEVVDEWKKDD